MEPIDLNLVKKIFDHMVISGVAYKLGAKAPSLDCDSHDIVEIDCSGFVRFVIKRATLQKSDIPDGSVNQHDWCKNNNLPVIKYDYVTSGGEDRLFIAFIKPVVNAHPGHVWLVSDSMTMESHGGRGVSSRPWNFKVLIRNVDECFELPVST